MSDLGNKLWGFCHTLRHEGFDYTEYIEQLTYLLFLKMADERGIEDLPTVPATAERPARKSDWLTLASLSGTDLIEHYSEVLRVLAKQPGLLGDIFAQARTRFDYPTSLKKLISLIDEVEWTALDIDVKGQVFEELLERAADEGKKGAGQYFTPRPLIRSIVRCMKPDPRTQSEFTIFDPACGSGGFLVAAYEWFTDITKGRAIERDLAKRVKKGTYFGQELVQRPRRLALMNLYLHSIEPEIRLSDAIYETPGLKRYDLIMTNPPFGTRGANQAPDRDDFVIRTTNKQLNFIQHVMSLLKPGGRAAIVVPDNCLFADQAGDVFEVLMQDCNLFAVLRLPNGTFAPYAAGVKTNVIFFTKGYPTEQTYIFDARTNVPRVTKKARKLTDAHFLPFDTCYGPDPNGQAPLDPAEAPENRWHRFPIEAVKERGYKLDSFKWLQDESLDRPHERPDPADLITDMMTHLEAAMADLQEMLALLENGNGRMISERTTVDAESA